MMFLFHAVLVKHPLTFIRLSDCMEYIPIAAQWAEAEWGYIRNKGIEYREEVIQALSHDVYIGTYAGQPVAMFALLEHPFPNPRELSVCELMYVYVDKKYQGLGFGEQIIEEAKRRAAAAGSDLILLDTLKPSLNAFYKKYGAKVMAESRVFSHPSDRLSFSI